ncbi:nucleic acid/nucleotide deaminase domain-containing protein [Streptomyces sp. RFCAC02]|uniref:nucleic acid/nucleotide deaminase domain-containing protein n=1 Tax=Streptomyces sp. RFCAC02 TaxID=2499143 RepID=UPI0010210262|nr:nucleic acid/nucleotide deaminase domain-containing protein [Streptomyces sp. RFCAC02]
MTAHDLPLRRFADRGGDVPGIAGLALPVRVGPYFSTDGADPVPLGAYAASVGRGITGRGREAWARLGTDRGTELCAAPDGSVLSVPLVGDGPPRFVNSSPPAFARSLAALHRALGDVLGAEDEERGRAAIRRFAGEVGEADPAALADPGHWWPLVLDDIRDTAGPGARAVFEIADEDGGRRVVTATGGLAVHPEERLWGRLNAAGVSPGRVLGVRTDLGACHLPGHYCAMWLAAVFPRAEITHRFPYGPSAASRAEGMRLFREAARQPAGG